MLRPVLVRNAVAHAPVAQRQFLLNTSLREVSKSHDSVAKAVRAELLAGLNWNSRLNVRLYYVWLWPLNVIKPIRRKH
ncbi:hypothetical protein [Paraburkholderia diazotrophica]|uniref:Uncharacterized protein n=1 Tax=Paraburkholderia diazotrophica TaxID=667676 RepID=A0A1H7DT36_9BURK|nr:hypothetical protein [Paraburkholderia diazotrophica]SEK02470.1 hypothetical protein SAMN05192539_103172 [Paraburkholderia diazotrophica]